jgi:hypothetical protein
LIHELVIVSYIELRLGREKKVADPDKVRSANRGRKPFAYQDPMKYKLLEILKNP